MVENFLAAGQSRSARIVRGVLLAYAAAGFAALAIWLAIEVPIVLDLLDQHRADFAGVREQMVGPTLMSRTIGVPLGLYLLGFAYLLPSIVASVRRHPFVGLICLANLVVGWTLVLWVILLAAAIWRPSAGFLARLGQLGRLGRLEVENALSKAPAVSDLDERLARREAELKAKLAK